MLFWKEKGVRTLGIALLVLALLAVWLVRTGGDGFSFSVTAGTDRSDVTERSLSQAPNGTEQDDVTERSHSQSANETEQFAAKRDDGRININTADAALLETLPGIGPAKASAILDYRRKAGGFRTVDQIMDVSGIGEKTFLKIRDAITVD